METPRVSCCSFNQDHFCLAQASTFGPLKYERHRATLRNGVVNCFESPLNKFVTGELVHERLRLVSVPLNMGGGTPESAWLLWPLALSVGFAGGGGDSCPNNL